MLPDKRLYLFFDELQRIDQWEDAVNSFRIDFDCDTYITGSNAYLLSSEYSTYLSGRYVEIKDAPLSFKEFLDFHGYEVRERKSPTGEMKKGRMAKMASLWTGMTCTRLICILEGCRNCGCGACSGQSPCTAGWGLLHCCY